LRGAAGTHADANTDCNRNCNINSYCYAYTYSNINAEPHPKSHSHTKVSAESDGAANSSSSHNTSVSSTFTAPYSMAAAKSLDDSLVVLNTGGRYCTQYNSPTPQRQANVYTTPTPTTTATPTPMLTSTPAYAVQVQPLINGDGYKRLYRQAQSHSCEIYSDRRGSCDMRLAASDDRFDPDRNLLASLCAETAGTRFEL
jgi:hypothetical protein